MLTVDRLSLRLPAGFEHRANRIAHLVVQRLASAPLTSSRTIEHLRVGEVETTTWHTDHDIATLIGQSIERELGEHARPSEGVEAW